MLNRGDEPIPGYTLEKFLGKGTFGEVWRASAPFGVKVALKFIDVSGKAGLKEFRGIQRVKDIRPAHLMPITAIWMLDEDGNILDENAVANLEKPQFDASGTMSLDMLRSQDEQQNASLLVVAMLLADDSLKARMEECFEQNGYGIPREELLDYMEQAARGIDFLNQKEHDIGGGRATIQHCDIKPENMMLVGDSVVICDFGLAQLLSDSQKTSTGMLGTPAYIAPEVLMTQRPSATTDQYSLACTYLHLRSGELPFDPTSSLPAVFEIHKTGRLNFAAIKGNLERQVVRKAAAVDPKKRYESNLDFIRELRSAVAEDDHLADELRGDRVKRYLKRAVAVLLLVAVLGGGGYFASPYGRPKFLAMVDKVRQMFESDAPVPPTTGSGSGGPGGGQADFAQFERMIHEDVDSGDWDDALRDWHQLPHESFPEKAENLREELLTELLAAAQKGLDEPGSQSLAHSRLIVGELEAWPESRASDVYRQIEQDARLLLARIEARSDQWDEVGRHLRELSAVGSDLGADEQRVVQALRVLERCSEDASQFFEDDVLDVLQNLGTEPLAESWESKQLDSLKFEAFGLLESESVKHNVDDPRLATIFGEGMNVLQTLARSSNALQGDSSAADFDTLRAELEEAATQATGPLRRRVGYLRAFLELKDPAVGLTDAIEQLPEEITAAESARNIGDVLLRRSEQAVVAGPVSATVLDAVERIVAAGQQHLPPVDATAFSKRRLAVVVVNRLHGSEFDQTTVLAECDQIRGTEGDLASPIAGLIDACWAECQLLKGITRATQPQVNLVYQRLADASTATNLSSYLAYVRARIAAERQGGERRAIEHLGPLLSTDETPVYLSVPQRRDFVGRLLADAAAGLKSAADDQIVDAAYEAGAADQAFGWLRSAVKLGVKSMDLKRNLALASFYRSVPDRDMTTKLIESFELSPETRADGQLLKVRAIAASQVADVDQREAFGGFADLLQWARNFDDSSKLQFHQTIVQPALDLCDRLEIDNLRDAAQPVSVESVPVNLRPSVAAIFSMSATLVEDDFDTASGLFPNDDTAAIEHRYYYFRAASALEPKEIEYLIGQYWALRDWPGRDYKAKANQLFDIARRAYELDKNEPEANGILGEAWVARSRSEVDTGKRKEYLGTAIGHFDVALTSQEEEMQEKFLPLRSTANVETAYLIGQVNEDKIRRLGRAAKDAERASAIQIRTQPAKALIAWGNATEDLAFYCRQNPDRHFKIAIDRFSQAARDAIKAEARATALMSLGRCRYRRAVHVERNYFRPSQRIDLPAEITAAIEELQDAVAGAQSDVIKSEALFWLSSTYDMREQREKNLEAKIAAKKSADESFQEAIRLAGPLTWADLNWAWARRAYFDAEYAEAKKRAQRILDEKEGDKFIVHWSRVFDALQVIFLSTPPDQRAALLEQYATHLPEADPSALYYRVKWFLLVPKQLNRLEYVAPYYREDRLLPPNERPDAATVVRFCKLAQQGAQDGKFPALEAQANTLLGMIAFNRWQADRAKTDLAAPLLREAMTTISTAASQLLDNEYAGLTVESVSLFALRHASLYHRVYSSSATSDDTKARIREEEVPRIKLFQAHVTDQGLKRTLNQFISGMR